MFCKSCMTLHSAHYLQKDEKYEPGYKFCTKFQEQLRPAVIDL